MAQPGPSGGPAGGPPSGTATTPRPATKPDVATILGNLGNLLQLDQAGKLTPTQLNQVSDCDSKKTGRLLRPYSSFQLRQLMATNTRLIVLQSMLRGQPNPLPTVPPHLDPSQAWAKGPALIPADRYQANIKTAEAEAKVIYSNLLTMARVKELLAMAQEDRTAMLSAVSGVEGRAEACDLIIWCIGSSTQTPILHFCHLLHERSTRLHHQTYGFSIHTCRQRNAGTASASRS